MSVRNASKREREKKREEKERDKEEWGGRTGFGSLEFEDSSFALALQGCMLMQRKREK